MKKYSVWFCTCGRIHVFPMEEYDWLEEDYRVRSIIQVCQNCGATYETYLTRGFEEGFDVCGRTIGDVVYSPDDLKNVKLFMGKGIRVPLKGGFIAEHYNSSINQYYDEDWNAYNVDTKALIEEVKDDEILQSIAGYVSGIDWTGTKYDIK